jgi:DNA-binding NarL/FixJ family response regulator
VIALLENAHVPTLLLLRAMGVHFLLSYRDPTSRILDVLESRIPAHYISSELQSAIEKFQSTSSQAATWGRYHMVEHLTPMELSIIIDLLQGISPRHVARKFFVSIKTVSTHKLNALKKLGIKRLNMFFIADGHY